MTPELIAELLARRESPTLDFKRDQYDWDEDGNLELAKDIMAIANGLAPGAACGYIIIGVDTAPDQTGRVVGVEPTVHLDDAVMHQKINHVLNRCPQFQYAPVESEGRSIGVFEIRPGGRPFYPLKTAGKRHKLTRFEARVRVGSSTDVASPEQIQAWAREDDAESRELRRIEIETREAQLIVRAAISIVDGDFLEDHQTGNDKIVHEVAVHNLGESRFSVFSVTQTWKFTEAFYSQNANSIQQRAATDLVLRRDPDVPVSVAPGTRATIQTVLSAADLGAYIHRSCDLQIASTNWYEWVDGEVLIECRGATGRSGVGKAVFDMPALRASIERARDQEIAARRALSRLKQR